MVKVLIAVSLYYKMFEVVTESEKANKQWRLTSERIENKIPQTNTSFEKYLK